MKPTVRPGAGVRDHDRQVRPILAGRGDNACGWLAAEYPSDDVKPGVLKLRRPCVQIFTSGEDRRRAGVGRHDANQNQHFPAVLDQVHGERYCSFCDWRPVEGRQYATNIGKSSRWSSRGWPVACWRDAGYGEDGETTRWPFMNGWTSHWK